MKSSKPVLSLSVPRNGTSDPVRWDVRDADEHASESGKSKEENKDEYPRSDDIETLVFQKKVLLQAP
jgi:hypothetical protein